jgi:hypothetical protein
MFANQLAEKIPSAPPPNYVFIKPLSIFKGDKFSGTCKNCKGLAEGCDAMIKKCKDGDCVA